MMRSPSHQPGSALVPACAGRSARGRNSPSTERLACFERPRGFRRRRCPGNLVPGSRLQPAVARAAIAGPVDGLRAHPQPPHAKVRADRMGRPPLLEALGDRRGQNAVPGQLGSPGTPRPGARRLLRETSPILLRAAGTGQLPLHRRAVPAQTPRDARRAEPRLGHRLDPSALVETQTPRHTENLHR